MSAEVGKRVLITGASGVLGLSVIERYSFSGDQVVGAYHSSGVPVSKSSQSIRWVQVDLANSEAVRSAFATDEFDIWIHCAGGFRFGMIEDLRDEDLEFLIDVNLKSAFYLARQLVPGMKKRNYGRIVFVSSYGTVQPSPGMAAYCASKAGLNLLTSVLTEETQSFDISVNAVLPTVIDTPANRKSMPQAQFSNWVSPQELADLIWTLTSSLGKPIRGALIPVRGKL